MFIILEIDAANQSAKSPRLSDGLKDQRLAPAEQERPPSELNTFATVVQRDINFWLDVAKGDIYRKSRRRCTALLGSCYGSRLLGGLEAKRHTETYLRLPPVASLLTYVLLNPLWFSRQTTLFPNSKAPHFTYSLALLRFKIRVFCSE